MRMRKLISLLLLAPSIAAAGIFDDLPDLKGKTVVYAGDFEQLTCPIGGKYDCLSWPTDFFKTSNGREICFRASSASCSFSCRGIIAVDESKNLYVYSFERMGSEAKKSALELYKCPSSF